MAIFRTADAFRATKMYLCGLTGTPPHRDITKTALGADESVEWEQCPDLLQLIERLKSDGYQIVALEQAAIDQQLSATCSDKCLGSGHGASRTKKLEIHVTASNKNRAVIMIFLRVLPRIFARLLDAAYRGKPWQPSRRGWGRGAAARSATSQFITPRSACFKVGANA